MRAPAPVALSQHHSGDYSLILAVNDNFDSLNLLCAILGNDRLGVLTAESGRAALEMVRETKPDLIISDVVMPGIDGIELCRRLKTDPATRDIPVLLLTALRFDEGAIVEGLRAGADDYLQAYVPIELLRKKVDQMIAEHKRTKAAQLPSEALSMALIENSQDIVTVLSADGTIRFENAAVERLLGYKPNELIGKSAFEFVHPDDAANAIKDFTRSARTPKSTGRLMFRFRHKNGRWILLESLAKNLLHEPTVAGVIVNSRDITVRERSDESPIEGNNADRLHADGLGSTGH